ncbi:putative profilin [Rhizodiscina lignyota]|uniref:Profilin n=1 Tax=Rhizodiscina lignyota TaxID=1504668 RepID=A0A9P4M401_9PEZI|nr:putative profilin [Rhizodiscina lignyota]
MSWDAYVNTSLVGTGNFDKAAIFSADGTSVWAATPGWNISVDEMKKVVGCLAKETDRNDAYGSGLHLAGERFVLTGADEKELKLKHGKEGAFIVKSTQAILIGHYPETVQPGSANTVIGQLGDYLVSVGY